MIGFPSMNQKTSLGFILLFLILCTFPLTNGVVVNPNQIEMQNNSVSHFYQNEQEVFEGYTLMGIIPNNMKKGGYFALLIDMDGNEIKRWAVTPDPVKMLPGGTIIAPTGEYYKEWDNTNLTQLDWNGTIEWDFSGWVADDIGRFMAREHHDFQREGNPVGYYAPGQDFVSYGTTLILAHNTTYNPNVSRKMIVDDVIYEVFWNGTLTGFEWHASEHISEMGFDSKTRIGIWLNPGSPGLILGCLPGDWLHINSMSLLGKNKWYDAGDERFNPENIIISSRHASFIAIISRTTGDIVWQCGPDFPKTSDDGTGLDRFIGLHSAHVIPEGLPGAGNILLFDNGGFSGYGAFGFPNLIRFYSRVLEFNPITFEVVQEYSHRNGLYPYPRSGDNHKLFSLTLCSVQRLPNGNTLVSEGLSGRVFELTSTNEVVWDYIYPDARFLYRAYRIPPEWVPNNPAGYPFWEELVS
jgi:hypothetical protein